MASAEKSDSLDVELDSSSGQRGDDSESNDLDARERPPESTNVTLAPEDRILGRCRLRYLVAQGGMASVYLAQFNAAQGFERWVAVKVVHPHLATDPRFIRMLLDEARITARVQHPNVCSVVDFGKDDGTCYLVMEYLHGESVATVIRRARKGAGLPWQLACRIMAEACRGLHAAHELRDQEGKALGIVHRDISPQNLFVLYDGVTRCSISVSRKHAIALRRRRLARSKASSPTWRPSSSWGRRSIDAQTSGHSVWCSGKCWSESVSFEAIRMARPCSA